MIFFIRHFDNFRLDRTFNDNHFRTRWRFSYLRLICKTKIVISIKRGFADISYNWRMKLCNFKINCIFDSVDVLFQFVDYLWVEEYTYICDVSVVVYGGYYTTFVETYYSGSEVGVNNYDGGTSLAVFC